MTIENQLSQIRDQIDAVDIEIQNLINQRANLALEVGSIKKSSEDKSIFYRPEREAKILENIIARNSGPLSNEQITAIFRSLLTACLTLQQPIRVAFLGPAGTYSQAAVFKHFGIETKTVSAATIERVFREAEADHADYGVVPIENSTTGIIHQTLDLLMDASLSICGEIILPIHHQLLSQENSLTNIKKVYAHEQALMQCQHWLTANLLSADIIPVSSNAMAAQMAAQENQTAAIAGEMAAKEYQIPVLVANIEDNPKNQTRFLILGQQKVGQSGNDKTSFLISTPHSPGFLFDLLKPFAEHEINISLIESRPYHHRNWAYLFFMDIEGHQDDTAVKQALNDLTQKSIQINILGSYPKGK